MLDVLAALTAHEVARVGFLAGLVLELATIFLRFGRGWMLKIKMSNTAELEELLEPRYYEQVVDAAEH